ncbi:MAG TPA: Lrp/AsnC family transcriptional regulator [Chloroflexi bacterium]|nr:Lrp/AsnC family transcriptional regulator [Chloroflexota bacterium]
MKTSKQIDAIDLAIIRMLNLDGRRSYANIAAELGLSPSTVQQRANRLINEGLLTIRGMVHPADLGDMIMAMIAIKAEGTRLRQVAAEVGKLPAVRWVVICAGQYDILLEVVCEDNNHLLSLISKELAKIDGVRETVTFPYLEITKRAHEWILPE